MRLIDADDLKEAIIELNLDNTSHWTVIHTINNAPTVTPDKVQALMSDYLIYRCEPKRPKGGAG